jgi:D-glycero-D-manno-heptose 1,7-bisphosphate phosphatase
LRGAVLLDRDGVIVQDVGHLTDPNDLVLLPGAAEAIRQLQDRFHIVVVTNQSAIDRGMINREKLEAIHCSLYQKLYSQGVFLDAIYACRHKPRALCPCRKPAPGMLLQASVDLGFDLTASYMIGDKNLDIAAGQRAKVKATFLIPSHQTGSSHDPTIVTPTFTAENLFEAAESILGFD